MRNAIKLILIITLLFIAFKVQKDVILSAFHANQYTATSDLHVRSGAGIKYSILFTLRKGEEVELLSRSGNWFFVQHKNERGYAYFKYLASSISVSDIIERFSQQPVLFLAIGITVVILLTTVFSVIRRPRVDNLQAFVPRQSNPRDHKPMNILTTELRGTRSERALVQMLMNWGIPKHMIFHDLYMEKGGDQFSQIDLAVVTDIGVIVIEVKDYSGWIYGTGNQMQWTQVLAAGKQKYLFQNPFRQNQGHIAALRRKINCTDSIPFYSVVVFYGDCQLHNVKFIPKGTYIAKSERVLEVLNVIMKNNEPFQYSNMDEVLRVLKEGETNGEDISNQIRHRENINDMLGTDRKFT